MVNHSKRAFLKYLGLSILGLLLYFGGRRDVFAPKEQKNIGSGDGSVNVVVEDGALVVK